MGKTDRVGAPRATIVPLSIGILAGIGAIQASVITAFFSPAGAILPLAIYLAACAIAPFVPRWGFFLPVVTRGHGRAPHVALTFDDGPSPETTPGLLALLARHAVPAAFFVVGDRAARHPALLRDIVSAGHEIGNHTMHHDTLIMMKSSRRLRDEIALCQDTLEARGIHPVAFRPPVGIVNPRLWSPLLHLGMYCVTFSVRGGDRGNARVDGISRRVLARVRPGDIILLHDTPPAGQASAAQWLAEIDRILQGLARKGLTPAPLSRVIGRPVMIPAGTGAPDAVETFYDGLAPAYDGEQESASMSRLRRAEQRAVLGWMERPISRNDRVLEIGAGSGRFTLPLARAAREVVAVDVSGRMLSLLDTKARSAGLSNIRTLHGDIREVPLEGTFRHIVAVSSLEYVADLPGLLRRVSELLEPGGTFYATTARRSFLRFWTQVGNALRQGLWLHARSAREVRAVLSQAGLTPLTLATHGTMGGLPTGMLLEILAIKH